MADQTPEAQAPAPAPEAEATRLSTFSIYRKHPEVEGMVEQYLGVADEREPIAPVAQE